MARRILQDQHGMAITEFALIAPVFLTLLLGSLDMGHTLYMQSVLQGVVQKAGRDSTLETSATTASQAALDTQVIDQVKRLNPSAEVTITRRFYRDFSEALQAAAEPYEDSNHDDVCNNGEPYEDTNNNNMRDDDGGDSGQGGAKDTVLYTTTVSYPRLFPIDKFIGMSGTVQLRARTVLANQPYGEQAQYTAPTVRNCG